MDQKPLKYLFAPDGEIPKTASARITRWEIVLMGFDYDLKYTPGEQIRNIYDTPFIPLKLRHLVLAKAHGTYPVKNATEASVRMIAWWPGTTQNIQHFISKCKNFQ